jgi:type I restriction enzyme S subunit
MCHLAEDTTGTQVPHNTKAGIESFIVPVPPEEEQREIARVLDATLLANRHASELLGKGLARAPHMRSGILRSAFEGRLVPQDPSDEPASALLERIKSERGLPSGKNPQRRTRRKPTDDKQYRLVPASPEQE